MLHVGRGRSAFHRNRKPQGTGGTPTPTPPKLDFSKRTNSMYVVLLRRF